MSALVRSIILYWSCRLYPYLDPGEDPPLGESPVHRKALYEHLGVSTLLKGILAVL